jgi:hypothetical protein
MADINGYDQNRLYGSIQRSDSDEVAEAIRSYSLGISSDPLASWSFNLEGEYWKQDFSMDSRGAKISAAYQNDLFFLQFSWLRNNIQILYNTNTQRRLDIVDQGQEINLQYFATDKLMLHASFRRHNYDKNISALDNPLLGQFFSNTTLSLAYGLEDTAWSVGGNYALGQAFNTGYRHARSRSAVDNSLSLSNEVQIDWQHDQWGSNLSLGRQTYEDTDDAVNYVNLSLSYYF